jgi:hypothetical protein
VYEAREEANAIHRLVRLSTAAQDTRPALRYSASKLLPAPPPHIGRNRSLGRLPSSPARKLSKFAVKKVSKIVDIPSGKTNKPMVSQERYSLGDADDRKCKGALRRRGIKSRIARKGVESTKKLGRPVGCGAHAGLAFEVAQTHDPL